MREEAVGLESDQGYGHALESTRTGMLRSNMDVEVREPANALDFDRYFELRWRVLREPWTDDRESGKDEHEAKAVHLMAWSGDEPVGVGRLNFNTPVEAQIRYMAVDPAWAGQGIGSTLLHHLERVAKNRGATTVVLNARESVHEFYIKHGYSISGDSYKLFGCIVHWRMSKRICACR
jgi:GNAT superfamily N-acetyltransferase